MAEMGHTSLEVAQKISKQFDLKISPDEYKGKVVSFYPDVFPAVKFMKGITVNTDLLRLFY